MHESGNMRPLLAAAMLPNGNSRFNHYFANGIPGESASERNLKLSPQPFEGAANGQSRFFIASRMYATSPAAIVPKA